MQRQLTLLFTVSFLAVAAAAQSTPSGNSQGASAAEPAAAAAPAPSAPDNPAFKSVKEKNGYAFGMQMGAGFRKQALDIDSESFTKGFTAAFSGDKTLMTEDEARAVLKAAQEDFQKQQAAIRAAKAEETKKASEEFLAANKSKDGVVTLADGLQYKILKAADGKKPDSDDTVVCNYRGTFIDGSEFDSSEKHNGPATFNLKGVIKGWTEALQLMPVGSKWELYLPPQLAYGETGAGNVVPPNSALIFDVELLSIKTDDKDAGKERDRE